MYKRCYIAGPITGIPENEYKTNFKAAKNMVHSLGFDPVSPIELQHVHDNTWEAFMKVDLRAMLTCQAIYMLEGWEASKGATIEWQLATILKMQIIYAENPTNQKPPFIVRMCNGCNNCVTNHEENCPYYRKLSV